MSAACLDTTCKIQVALQGPLNTLLILNTISSLQGNPSLRTMLRKYVHSYVGEVWSKLQQSIEESLQCME